MRLIVCCLFLSLTAHVSASGAIPPYTGFGYINHKSNRNLRYVPMRYCAGTSQDFLLPNFAQNTESTMGAQSTFMEKG